MSTSRVVSLNHALRIVTHAPPRSWPSRAVSRVWRAFRKRHRQQCIARRHENRRADLNPLNELSISHAPDSRRHGKACDRLAPPSLPAAGVDAQTTSETKQLSTPALILHTRASRCVDHQTCRSRSGSDCCCKGCRRRTVRACSGEDQEGVEVTPGTSTSMCTHCPMSRPLRM